MDNYIRKVSIKSLFSTDNNLSISFKDGINCIFGVNGSGKTTVINLLVSCLDCDLNTLNSIPFSEIKVLFARSGQTKGRIFIKVSKSEEKIMFELPVDEVYVEFEKTKDGSWISTGKTKKNKDEILKYISNSLKLTYVPLTRMHTNEMSRYIQQSYDYQTQWRHSYANLNTDINFDYSNIMLEHIENEFKSKYTIVNNTIAKDQNKLKNQIVSKMLIDRNHVKETGVISDKMLFGEGIEDKLSHGDVLVYYDKFRSANVDIPEEKLTEHFKIMDEMLESLRESKEKYESLKHKDDKSDVSDSSPERDKYLNNFFQLHSYMPIFNRFFAIIDDIEASEKKRNKLLGIFYKTEDLVNDFLSNKTFNFDNDGGFKILCNNQPIPLKLLSSGEKHMIALIGRVALSPEESAVFVADEPELSLHLDWQRKILPSISRLSSQMQVIVATHSPAIIPDDSNMIDLEECFNG